MKINIVVTEVVSDVTYSRKSVNTRVVINFYYMTLSIGKQRRRMINVCAKTSMKWVDHTIWVE